MGITTTTNGMANKRIITSNGTTSNGINVTRYSCCDNNGTTYTADGTSGDNGAASNFGDIEPIEFSTSCTWTSITTSGIIPSSGIVSR